MPCGTSEQPFPCMIVRIPRIIRTLYPGRVWEGPNKGKRIYLTFDDGPISRVTPWVLQQLKVYEAKATFFCIGDNIRKHPEVFTRIISEGHAVGNHTYSHLNGWKTGTKEYVANTEKAQEILEQHMHSKENTSEQKAIKNVLFRPPYGRINSAQVKILEQKGYKIVMWDILSMDYNPGISPEKCTLNVTDNARSGSIIIFHDSLKAERNLKFALPKVLEHFSSQGYSFDKLQG